jgi:hypothetical protein
MSLSLASAESLDGAVPEGKCPIEAAAKID